MATAHFRRALALHGLKRFGDARMCLNWCNKYNPKESGLTLWMSLVTKAYEDAGGEEAEGNKVTVLEVPKVAKVATEAKAAVAPAASTAPKATPREKIRHEWFQTGKTISIEILAAGVEEKTLEVLFEPRSVRGIPILQEPLLIAAGRSHFPSRRIPHHIQLHSLSPVQPHYP